MSKPYVIIHTHISVDGRIHAVDIPAFQTASQQYQELALDPDLQIHDIDGYLNGRTTTDDNRTHYRTPKLNEDPEVPEGDFVATSDAQMYYISIDPSGKLDWEYNVVDYGGINSHIIEVITAKVGAPYREFLRRQGISYIVAGEETLDMAMALEKLNSLFGMKRVMIGGGGVLNWSFLHAGLVDEVSLVVAPFADGDTTMPGLFSAVEPFSAAKAHSFTLIEARELRDSVLLVRYQVRPNASWQ